MGYTGQQIHQLKILPKLAISETVGNGVKIDAIFLAQGHLKMANFLILYIPKSLNLLMVGVKSKIG